MNCRNCIQKQTKTHSRQNCAHWETLTSTTVGMNLYHKHTLKSVINTTKRVADVRCKSDFHTVSSARMWREIWRLMALLNSAVFLGELLSEFTLPKLGGTCRMINNSRFLNGILAGLWRNTAVLLWHQSPTK